MKVHVYIIGVCDHIFVYMEVFFLPDSRKIVIDVPADLLSEVDTFSNTDNKNRSEIVKEAIVLYLAERKRSLMKEQMKKGYQEMAAINLCIAAEDN